MVLIVAIFFHTHVLIPFQNMQILSSARNILEHQNVYGEELHINKVYFIKSNKRTQIQDRAPKKAKGDVCDTS